MQHDQDKKCLDDSLIAHVQGAWMNCTIFPREQSRTMPYDRMVL
jgi:hypothetical protein